MILLFSFIKLRPLYNNSRLNDPLTCQEPCNSKLYTFFYEKNYSSNSHLLTKNKNPFDLYYYHHPCNGYLFFI